MYFTQNLLDNWIFGGNLVVDKTLRKLRKATTSRDNDICYNCYLLLVEQGKGCAIQSLSADHRGQTQSKNPHNKETKRKKSGKKSCVSSSLMSLIRHTNTSNLVVIITQQFALRLRIYYWLQNFGLPLNFLSYIAFLNKTSIKK